MSIKSCLKTLLQGRSESRAARADSWGHCQRNIQKVFFLFPARLLIEDKKLAKKIGENGKKLVEAFFSQNFAINQWKKIIN